MKKISLIFAFAIGWLAPVLPSTASDLFNPMPATIESPRDDADTVTKRLTISSDGKTPVVKNLDPTWIRTLADRGTPTLYTKANSHNFDYIGMPIGGIGAGEIYLSGDGRLWDWDLFGTRCQVGFPVEQGLAYTTPHVAGAEHDPFQQALEQGFVIRTVQGGKADTRTLDRDGFSDVTFSGQYPIGSVDYTDSGSPVHVHLDAFSPFIPGDVEDSTYPATILNYTVENTSQAEVDCTLGGWMENPVAISLRNQTTVLLQNSTSKSPGYTALNFAVKEVPVEGAPPTMFDDFESGKYDHWTVEGEAFGDLPSKKGGIRHNFPVVGMQGEFFVDSLLNKSDKPMGKLTSESFVVSRPYLTFLIGGGKDAQNECVNLLVDGAIVRTATGQQDEILRQVTWDVRDLNGKTAQLQILDQSSGSWGHIMVDNIAFADSPIALIPIKDQSDVGNMTFALLGNAESTATSQVTGDKLSDACLDAAAVDTAEAKVFGEKDKLVGALRRTHTLKPGEKMTVSFIVSWYFPNPLSLGLITSNVRQYAARFKSAQDVVDHLVPDLDRLTSATRLWRDTWYDSTLPYYFLDRTFLNTSTLASSTSYLLSDGRFYGYEGRYSCPGTCTHVWGYQQAMGNLFPDLEKSIMEKVEFVPGLGMNNQGGVAMRGEYDHKPPVDGQAGIILRTYLAHRMSADDSFLQHNYASVKKAMDFLVNVFDPDKDGILDGAQANTMDAAWFGKITWLSLHYQAALRATAEMADASNDGDYAKSLRVIADKGRAYIESQLFNGEYFIQQPDPAHPASAGTFTGCPIEQLMGQNWAYEVGLGDIVDHGKAVTALNSIWKYNYTTDAGLYRDTFKIGRWYALKGEGALIMCTFPQGGEDALKKGDAFASAYDNETWAGSEHEATALMMWDGLVDKALAEVRTIQDRYDGSKRNPWDECECGSHYSRSMASYGVFVAASGFEYNGPEGSMAFAPRVGPEDFKAAFTSAEGWGSFRQKYVGQGMIASLGLRYGKLHLKTFSLILPAGSTAQSAKAQVNGQDQPLSVTRKDNRITLAFSSDVSLTTGQSLNISVNP
jgi:non-lysosomal glucosylceramidase